MRWAAEAHRKRQ